MIMKKRAFTLIEIMASLMVFAIGGTLALSVFNFTTANRITMHEKNEAQLLASNLLKTYMLKSITDPLTINTTADLWVYPGSHPSGKGGQNVIEGFTRWDWNTIPVHVVNGSLAYSSAYGAANTFYVNYRDTNSPKRSIFEYGFSFSQDIVTSDNELTIHRPESNHDKDIDELDIFDPNTMKKSLFAVVVRWPLNDDDPTDDSREESKRVFATAVVNHA